MKRPFSSHNERFMPTQWKHGVTGYNYRHCRCDICRKANADRMAKQRGRRHLNGLPENDSRHGTTNAYTNYGCRCQKCIKTNSAASQNYRIKLTHSEG